jgi:hypothetical protein
MEDSLRTRCPALQPVVLNAAFAGMSLPTVAQDIQLRVLPLRPKTIVYYASPGGYLAPRSPVAAPRVKRAVAPLSPWRSRALPRLRDAVKGAVPVAWLDLVRRGSTWRERRSGQTVFSTLPTARLDSFETHLRRLVGAVRGGGAEIVLGVEQNRFADTSAVVDRQWLRAWERFFPKATGAMLLTFDSLAARRIRRVAADSSVLLFEPDLGTGAHRASMFADAMHFTDSGAAVMGGAAADRVSHLLGCPNPPAGRVVEKLNTP